MNSNSFDDRSLHIVGCGDLYEILADLAERRLLGALELSCEGRCVGYVNVSVELTAALITHAAAISSKADFTTVSLIFTDEEMTLNIRGTGEAAASELARLARLGITAGFESRYTDGSLVLSAPVRRSATLNIYAVKPAWLRDLFEKCFARAKTH